MGPELDLFDLNDLIAFYALRLSRFLRLHTWNLPSPLILHTARVGIGRNLDQNSSPHQQPFSIGHPAVTTPTFSAIRRPMSGFRWRGADYFVDGAGRYLFAAARLLRSASDDESIL